MSGKEREVFMTEGSRQDVKTVSVDLDDAFMQLFDSSSSNGSSSTTSTITGVSNSCSSSSLDCSSDITDVPPHASALALRSPPANSCKLQPPSNLQSADVTLSPPLKLPPLHIKPSPSPPAPLRYPRKVEHQHTGAVKRSMGLMKLRRQGSHPPACNYKGGHGSLNQAAAARELMASLERLSMKEKTMAGTNEEREREAQRALLAGEGEESLSAAASREINGKKLAELPLTAKIAAAMDAEGLVGVQEEIARRCDKHNSSVLRSLSDQYSPLGPVNSALIMKAKSRMPRAPGAAAAGSGDNSEVRAVPPPERKVHLTTLMSKRCSSRWIILRRLRSTRPLLGKIWIKIKRLFSSSSRKHLRKELLNVNTKKI